MPGLVDIDIRARSTNSLTHSASVRDSGTDSFGDQVAFKLRHGTHDVEQKFAARRSGVDAFREADEINSERPELFEAVDQVLYRAGEAIEFPNQDHVKPPLTSVLQDRKSTRLNSSHGYISYAVFCLKK